MYAVPDDSPLTYPDESSVVRGQLEPGLMLHACPMTEEGTEFVGSRSKQDVAAINPGEGGDSAGAAAEAGTIDAGLLEIPEEKFNSEAACEFGEHLCQKTVKDWAAAPGKDDTARVVMTCLANGTPSSDITGDGLDPTVDVQEVKRLVAQGELMEPPNSEKLLVRSPSRVPADRPNRHPGQYERLLGDEPVRTYVPLLLRPWVMDCAHKEAVHLGEKVTLGLLQRFYWWIGMA